MRKSRELESKYGCGEMSKQSVMIIRDVESAGAKFKLRRGH